MLTRAQMARALRLGSAGPAELRAGAGVSHAAGEDGPVIPATIGRAEASITAAMLLIAALGVAKVAAPRDEFAESGQIGPSGTARAGSILGPDAAPRGSTSRGAETADATTDPPSQEQSKMLSKLAGVTAVAVGVSASIAGAEGLVLVADSRAQFSGVQSQAGWRYLFDRGDSTPIEEMAHFTPYNATPDNGAYAWCPEPTAGFGGSFCMLHRDWAHTNAAYACSTPAAGLQRPIRSWDARPGSPLVVLVHADLGGPGTSAVRLDVLNDETVVASWQSNYGNNRNIDARLEFVAGSRVSFRLDPVDGCAGDGIHDLSILIYERDCNNDGIIDYGQISTGQLADLNGDGIPDVCQQPTCIDADFFPDRNVNGADLGILISQWGEVTQYTVSDLNGDGVVDGQDLGIFISFWGPCTP